MITYLSLHLIANTTLGLVYENAPECTISKWKRIKHLGIAPSPGHTPPPRRLRRLNPHCFFDKLNTGWNPPPTCLEGQPQGLHKTYENVGYTLHALDYKSPGCWYINSCVNEVQVSCSILLSPTLHIRHTSVCNLKWWFQHCSGRSLLYVLWYYK